MEEAARSNLKVVALELGGKSPFIIFDDIDVDKVAPLALNACFFNQVTSTIIYIYTRISVTRYARYNIVFLHFLSSFHLIFYLQTSNMHSI